MTALKKKISNSSPGKGLRSPARRRTARRSSPGKMPADVLAKLIIGIVTGLLLLGFTISFLVPSSREPGLKTNVKSYEGKLEYAREKCREGKDLIRKAESSSSPEIRNGLLKEAEDILWKSKEVYVELIDAHNEKGFKYLQTEIEGVQSYIYHCQKTRTITR